jgi:ATP-dependent Clp protease adapter protein ClpS
MELESAINPDRPSPATIEEIVEEQKQPKQQRGRQKHGVVRVLQMEDLVQRRQQKIYVKNIPTLVAKYGTLNATPIPLEVHKEFQAICLLQSQAQVHEMLRRQRALMQRDTQHGSVDSVASSSANGTGHQGSQHRQSKYSSYGSTK